MKKGLAKVGIKILKGMAKVGTLLLKRRIHSRALFFLLHKQF